VKLTDLEVQDKARTLSWKEKVFWSAVVAAGVFYALALAVVVYWVFFDQLYPLDIEHGVIISLLLVAAPVLAIQVFKLVDSNTAMTAKDLDNHPATKLLREILVAQVKKL
jgi:hypothetical protein